MSRESKRGFKIRRVRQAEEVEPPTSTPSHQDASSPTSESILAPEPEPEPEPEPAAAQINPTLISNFVHQIVSPLNAIMGTLSNVVDGTIPTERVVDKVSAAKAQLSVTVELVRNLAYLSSLSTEAGRESMRQNAQPESIPKLVVEAAQFFQEPARRKNIKINLKDPYSQYKVKVHRDLLRQVFINIIDNDVKYGDTDTPISIHTRVQKKTGDLVVEFESYGPGFDADEIPRLFDLDFRGRAAREALASGSGIGLYIARDILALYSAAIEAEHSHAHRRTIFRLRFREYELDRQATEEFRDEKTNPSN